MHPFTLARSFDSPHRGQVIASSSPFVDEAGLVGSGLGTRERINREMPECTEINTEALSHRDA
jgi:hypothetical protein